MRTEWGNIYKMHNTLHIVSSLYVKNKTKAYEYLFVTDFISEGKLFGSFIICFLVKKQK